MGLLYHMQILSERNVVFVEDIISVFAGVMTSPVPATS